LLAHVEIFNSIRRNDHKKALSLWEKLAASIPLLFMEPNPAPLNYCPKKFGLISSAELRLPLVEISRELKTKLDKFL
jgi:4-hydroxy-tetrahydrodipicolinate synthase